MSRPRKLFIFFLCLTLLSLIFGFKKEKREKRIEVYSQTPFVPSQEWPETPEFVFVEKTSLRSSLPPSFVENRLLATIEEERGNEKEIKEYIVEEGDTLISIAEKFDISLETILWVNNLNKNSLIAPGKKLVILPVSGLLHQVEKGNTLSEIAQRYQANIEEIISFNELESPDDIYVGDFLIIPDGKMPPKTNKNVATLPPAVPVSEGYFVCPVSRGCHLTQGLHWYNAVDFSNGQCGEPIIASAGGTVQKAKYGWNGGAGNVVTILHPNGAITLYGHLQRIFVSPGENVLTGQIIGLMGNSGRSTGCHLHFGVYGAKNPFGY